MVNLTRQHHYVGGRWQESDGAEASWICDANIRAPLQAKISAPARLIQDALAGAHACHTKGDWARDHNGRADALDRIALYLSDPDRLEAIALGDSVTTGVVINLSRRLAAMLPLLFTDAANVIREGYLSQTHRGPLGPVEYFRRPWGPALLMSPWNSPTPIGAHKLASALAAGAPALVKPSSWTPHSAVAMFDAIDACDLPVGAASLLLCDRHAIAPLMADTRVRSISFTGGLAGGRAVATACAPDFKPTQLELGGNNALVVLEGADLDAAATAIVFALCNLNGQWCRALGRVIVARTHKSRLLDLVLEKLSDVRLGSSLDENSHMGPQAHLRQWEDVNRNMEALIQKGGQAISATPLPDLAGYFVVPTLIDGLDPAETQHEIFGPVAAVHCFDTQGEALALANAAPFGLAGYVFGPTDTALAFAREMATGGVKVNGANLMALNGDLPRGAWMLSGLHEEGRRETVRFFTGPRVVGAAPQDRLGV